jgi:hypothetical protein
MILHEGLGGNRRVHILALDDPDSATNGFENKDEAE